MLGYTQQKWQLRKRYNDFKRLHSGLLELEAAPGMRLVKGKLALPAKEPAEGWEAALSGKLVTPEAQLEWRRASLDDYICQLLELVDALSEQQQLLFQGERCH